jgi:transposase
MAMGKRTSKQAPMSVAATELPVSPGHPIYSKLNTILDETGFDRFAEEQCQGFYAPVMGRPSLPPGRYFRLLPVGYFEGLDSERGMAWRAADSLAVRTFVRLDLDTAAPDHSTISRTRRLIDVETLYRGGDRPLVRAVSRGKEADWPGGRRSGERNWTFIRPLCGLYALTAVDGTAAGDAFCGALVVSLLQGRERGEALARACAAGAIAASRPGAQPSLPTAAKLEEILAR